MARMTRWIVLVGCVALACGRNRGEDPGEVGPDGSEGADAPTSPMGGDGGPGPADAASGVDALTGMPGEFALTFEGRDYFLYVPSGYTPAQPIPLVVAFHGACKSGAEFYDNDGIVLFREGAEPASYVLVVPDTKGGCSSTDGFCPDFILWPPSCDPNETVPEITGEMDGIVALIDEIGRSYQLDRRQIHAMGHSDGGLFTAVGGFSRSELFASLSVFSMGWGAGYPLVRPDRKIPIQFICGGDDTSFCDPAQESEPWLAMEGHPTRLRVIPGEGHGFKDLVVAMTVPDLFGWMHDHPRP